MVIFIKAKPKSKKEFVKKIDATHYVVAVNEPPVDNKANEAIIKSLANYFNISKSLIVITAGQNTKQKIVEVSLTLEELEKIGEPSVKQTSML